MEPKPLKNKIECFDGRVHKNGKHFEDCDMYFSVQNTKLAVEWLKEILQKDLEIQLKAKRKGQAVKLDFTLYLIDEAFPDLNLRFEK